MKKRAALVRGLVGESITPNNPLGNAMSPRPSFGRPWLRFPRKSTANVKVLVLSQITIAAPFSLGRAETGKGMAGLDTRSGI
jgi:hypothetical protein